MDELYAGQPFIKRDLIKAAMVGNQEPKVPVQLKTPTL
jgi:hypothetical protein